MTDTARLNTNTNLTGAGLGNRPVPPTGECRGLLLPLHYTLLPCESPHCFHCFRILPEARKRNYLKVISRGSPFYECKRRATCKWLTTLVVAADSVPGFSMC